MTDEPAATAATIANDAGGASRKKRRPYRREQILDEAVRLFAEHGYHATGMNDIGAAVGISGPGIYRHFDSKEAILEAALEQAADEMLAKVEHIVQTSDGPRDTLERLVLNAIDVLLAKPDLIMTAIHERKALSERARTLFDRSNRLRIEEWAHPLGQLRPELSENECRFIVTLTVQMLLAGERFRHDVEQEYLRRFLFNLAMAALMADRPEDAEG